MYERFNKKDLSRKIERIALCSNRIKVFNKNALTLLQRINTKKEKHFVYLDPPYYKKSKQLYYNTYKEADHEQLSSFLKSKKNFFWTLSYDNCTEIRKLYLKNKTIPFNINYSLQNKRLGKEIMIFDKKINIDQKSVKQLHSIQK